MVVFTLAVGIGANTAMFSIVNGVLLQGLPFQHPERIVDLNEVERRDLGGGGAIAPATFLDWRKMATSFDVMSVFATRTYNVTPTTGEPARVRGTMTSSSFFDVLGVPPILGRAFTREDAEPGRGQNVVLSFGFWQRQFAGSADVINQTVRLNGQPHTMVGVMPATLNFPDASNFWVPAALRRAGLRRPPDADPREQRGAHCLRGIAPPERGNLGAAGQRGTGDHFRSARASSIRRSRRTSSASRRRCRTGWSGRRARRCSCCSARSDACC